MGGILSRFSSRKDEKPATDSRSAATIRKRWSWRSNKKPSDVGGTTVNRSSTMPTRTRLQPTEEIPEDRKHDDIFDSEHDEKNYSNSVVTSNQNDYASQHSSGQQEQHNVECANKPIVHEIPEKKDEKQPIQISSTNEPENKDNVTREISTEEAELLISHVLPNQENVGPNENITGSGTNGSLTHDNINFNHTEDLIVNKQQLEEKLDHSIHDSGLMMDQQEITKDQNGFFDSTQHHFEDKTDLLKEYIHSEITGEEIKLGQNPPVYLPSEEIEEFVHQNIRKHDSNQQLKVENDIIEQGGEENLNTESSNHNEVTQPVICFYRPNVVEYPPPEEIQLNDIDEQTYNQQTNIISNIQSSGIVGEKDSIYGQVVQNESLECSAELRAFHDLSNNEELPNSELIDKDNKVNFVETENTLDNVISEHVEQKNTFQETLEKELNESLMNAGETKILSADEPPINLNDKIHVEQTEKISHPENMESINLGDEIHVEQTEKISHPENMESINLGDEIHVEQTENISHPKYTEHDAPIDEKATLNELDKCSSQPGLTYDPVPSLSPITTESNNLDDDMHAEQNQYTSPSESNVNNNIPVEKSIHTVLESPTEPVTEYNFSSNESHFTSELVLSEDNKEVTKDVDLEHSTEDLKTEDIHRKQINDTETLTTFEESVNNLHNTLNSTHIDDVIDQHQTLETLHDENHTDVQLNTDIMNVITSENLHTNLINANDEFEYEAQSLVQSVLNNAKEFVFNENNFENHQNSDTINTNLILTNNNSNNNDYLTNNNSYINEEDTIEGMKQNMTMKASMEFDHSDLSESNNQHLNNTNDLTIA
ncbi:unnamed protein product [Schistosoma rodhaini]|uniref:Spc7 domain-containing protein n=1 Tax=Schistosoma rodhaini TaxID=6188 RepID=A0AA85GD63_9TREM|nr:unnamed protein product [Schistosoma rodhaini]